MANYSDEDKRMQKILHELADLKYKDLKGECIMRGMSFDDIVKADHNKLGSYFIRAYDTRRNEELLKIHEEKMDAFLAEKGYSETDPLRAFREFTGEEKPEVEEVIKIAKPKKEPKPPKVKDKTFNIFSGTKKQLTYELAHSLFKAKGEKYKFDHKELCSKFSGQLFVKVQAKFPEAQDKSVKIWMSRCMKGLCDA